ncbi:MAG: hypothetical protein CME62_03210 [Halobacteriovoraceae bacterium]|nr:hypothetical protein [Halobacteriovoraceae bacterium]|tara:strand:+ start:3100 stop:4104 length:1005 start_codon:yes stop_codon:yes gene_type:complete
MTKKQKICSRLWNGMMIRHDGHVYPCCGLGDRPQVAIGNIGTDPINNIINGEKITAMRKASLESTLACYDNCDQVKYFEVYVEPNPEKLVVEIENYKDLMIEYGEKCNVDCIMCWQDRDNPIHLRYEDLAKKLPVESWGKINIFGGEVFVIKDAVKHMFDLLNSGKKNLTITTNGLALRSDRMAREIVEKGAELIISINAATEETHNYVMQPKEPFFYILMEILKKLQNLKKELNRLDFRVVGQFTTVPESLWEIPMFIRNFKAMGFDIGNVTFDHRYFPHGFENFDLLPDSISWNGEKMAELKRQVTKAYTDIETPEDLNLTAQEFLLETKSP